MKTAIKLTAKAKRDNAHRARQARAALDAYAEITNQHGEDDGTLLCDLLADCMHLLGRHRVQILILRAADHYEAEARGED